MTQACVLLAPGFEEIEAVTIIDVLRRAEITTQAVGVEGLSVRGSHDIEVKADIDFREAESQTWSLVVLPGGTPGAYHLRDREDVQRFIKKQANEGRYLAAICAAPIALGKAGLLSGKHATSYPGFENELIGATTKTADVVVDGKTITSRGPGTALSFAIELVKQLRGEDVAQKLSQNMLHRRLSQKIA